MCCCLFVALMSQQHASVSQGRICSDNCTRCHTEIAAQTLYPTHIEAADQTLHLTQSQYTDTGPTSPSADHLTPGAWQGNLCNANFLVTGMTRPGKDPRPKAEIEPESASHEANALTARPTRRCCSQIRGDVLLGCCLHYTYCALLASLMISFKCVFTIFIVWRSNHCYCCLFCYCCCCCRRRCRRRR